MKKIILVLLLMMICAAVGLPQKSTSREVDLTVALNSLAENERAFAKLAATQGVREAFLAYIADDCVLFRPKPVSGKKWWSERPAASGLLSWEPSYVDISFAGDLGYSVGPWEFRPKGPDDKPAAYGYYMSIWKKQADGSWKFVIDQGAPTPPHTSKPGFALPRDIKRTPIKNLSADLASVKDELLKFEQAFSKSSSENTLKAFRSYASDDIRLLRPGDLLFIGKDEMEKALTKTPGTLVWEVAQAFTARSGDLGYTFGIFEFSPSANSDKPGTSQKGNYVHIWKKSADGKWKVVFEVLNPYGISG